MDSSDAASVPVPGSVFQFAYTAEDAEATALAWTETVGIGPWSVRGPFVSPTARYRGRPNTASLTVARTFDHGVMVELIQQHDEQPSIFRDRVLIDGYGFHHVAVVTPDFQERHDHLQSVGGPPVFVDDLPTGARVAFFEGAPGFPGMVELVELTAGQQQSYNALQRLCAEWDGTLPWRPA